MAVTDADLIDELKEVPIDIVERMLYYQQREGNTPNVKVFQRNRCADRWQGGFCWDNTEEGPIAWMRALVDETYDELRHT